MSCRSRSEPVTRPVCREPAQGCVPNRDEIPDRDSSATARLLQQSAPAIPHEWGVYGGAPCWACPAGHLGALDVDFERLWRLLPGCCASARLTCPPAHGYCEGLLSGEALAH